MTELTIAPTKHQLTAINTARKMLATKTGGRNSIMILSGFAGTGKTVSLNFIAKELGHIVILAPTGRAALRVNTATGLDASTIHRWLYKPIENPNTGEMDFIRKDMSEITKPESGLLVIDEASMIDNYIWEDLNEVTREMGCDVLLVGDPFQLPPVRDSSWSVFGSEFEFDYRVQLTEIMRQALDNPIIKASMMVRKGDWVEAIGMLPSVQDDELVSKAVSVVDKGGVVICFSNKTRHLLNAKIRAAKGVTGELQPGESLLIRKNNYQVGIFNGELVKFEGWKYQTEAEYNVYDPWKKLEIPTRFGRTSLLNTDCIMAHSQLEGKMDEFSLTPLEKRSKLYVRTKDPFIHANYGYALTCHSAQGSEFDEVLVVLEDSLSFKKIESLRWLYTALTRSKKHVSISYKPDLDNL